MSKGKVDPCGVCSLRVKAKSVLCLQCGEWIHGRYFHEILHTENLKGILERQWSRKKP